MITWYRNKSASLPELWLLSSRFVSFVSVFRQYFLLIVKHFVGYYWVLSMMMRTRMSMMMRRRMLMLMRMRTTLMLLSPKISAIDHYCVVERPHFRCWKQSPESRWSWTTLHWHPGLPPPKNCSRTGSAAAAASWGRRWQLFEWPVTSLAVGGGERSFQANTFNIHNWLIRFKNDKHF